MIRVWINFDELAAGCASRFEHGWSFPGGEVEPYEHPLLESRMYAHSDGWTVVVRERVNQRGSLPACSVLDSDSYTALHEELADWPLDWLRLTVDHRLQRVSLQVGALGVAPVYVANHGRSFVASWQLYDHLDYLRLSDIDRGYLAHYLVGTGPYASNTLFTPVKLVTERSLVHASATGLKVEVPSSAPYYCPCPLKKDADVPAAFVSLLKQTLGQWTLPDTCLLSEFSGGFDSALVSAVLAGMQQLPLQTYALGVEGEAANQQEARRWSMVSQYGFGDTLVHTQPSTVIHSTFEAQGGYLPAPFNADYQLPLRRAFRKLGCKGGETIATGTGGDELVMPHHFELSREQKRQRRQEAFMPEKLHDAFRPCVSPLLRDVASRLDDLPYSVVPYSSLQAHAARAPLFLSEGLWPISPLSHPHVVRFARCLPLAWREQKRLQAATLLHLGVAPLFLQRPLRENFIPLLLRSFDSAKAQLLTEAKRGLVLEELDLVDGAGFAALMREIRGTRDILQLSAFYNIYNLECLLRRLPSSTRKVRLSHAQGVTYQSDVRPLLESEGEVGETG